MPSEDDPIYDCVIIGGGPAGLTAATYLGRFRRRVVLIDAGKSRLAAISWTYNAAGFPQGISGTAIWGRLKRQARRYGAEMLRATATGITPDQDGSFSVAVGRHAIKARTVLLATGVVLVEPKLAGLPAPLATGYFRPCPICDGFEASGKRIAVLGHGARAVHEAQFLLTYTSDIKIITLGRALEAPEDVAALKQRGIDVLTSAVKTCRLVDGAHCFEFEDDSSAEFDVVYGALGPQPPAPFIQALGLKADSAGCIAVQGHQRTSREGIFAAGDMVEGLDQINVAAGHGAIAATAIHNYLREKFS